MKETRFIAQNKEKWLESENLLKSKEKDPEKLANLFTQVIDDLSFSRTYYPNRSVRVYLNRIGREYFNIIYSHKKGKKNRFTAFWMDELPQIVYTSRKPLLLSLVVFLFAAGIGVFSSIKDGQFASSILGADYVAMTKENIESGDPMAVYKSANQLDMFLSITVNNIKVAFMTYVFGVFFSLGTIMILIRNGIMVGCFQYFFIERDLFTESALSIWLHGTLEISSIIIAGGAGLILGSGLIFPGTYSRLQAFQMSAIRSLKLMLGIAPLFVIAGLIESFLTRYTEVSDLLKLFLIILSAAFIIGYFVIYPWMKARAGFDQPLEETKLPPTNQEPIHYDRIKNNAEIIKDSFMYYKKYAGQLFGWVAFVTLLMCVAELFNPEGRSDIVTIEEWYRMFTGSIFHALNTPNLITLFINTVGTSLILYRVMMYVDADARKAEAQRYNILAFLQTLVITGLFFIIIHFLDNFGVLLAFLVFFILLLISFTQHYERTNLISSIFRTFGLATENFGKVLGLQVIIILLLFSFLTILSTPVLYYNTTMLEWNFAETDTWAAKVIEFIDNYIKIFAFNLTLPLMGAIASLLYFSLVEISTAQHLKALIQSIGTKSVRRK